MNVPYFKERRDVLSFEHGKAELHLVEFSAL